MIRDYATSETERGRQAKSLIAECNAARSRGFGLHVILGTFSVGCLVSSLSVLLALCL